MNKYLSSKKIILSSLVPLFTYVPTVLASGYHFGTQSVSAQSTANASAAEAKDASTIYYNPAGVSKLEGTHLSVNANIVAPHVEYDNAQAFYFNQDSILNGDGNTKESGKITDGPVIAPHMYATHQINDDWSVGVYVPFASGTEYDSDSVIRYNIYKMGMKSIDINPTVSYKINDQHSVAVGLIGQYMQAELEQASNLGLLVGKNNGIDAIAKLEGSNWGLGFNAGYLWDINDKTRIGASYRSAVDHTIKGDLKWDLANFNSADASTLEQMGYAAKEGANVELITPESLSVHGQYEIDDRWTAFGDVTWTRHSRFKKLQIDLEKEKAVGNAAEDVNACHPFTPLDRGCKLTMSNKTLVKTEWQNTVKVGFGAAYQYNDKLQLRGGVAFDESPIKSANYRLGTMPDNDRIWYSVGAKYAFNDKSSLNVGYSYINIKDSSAKVNGWCGGTKEAKKNCVSSQTNGSADYKSHAHILGVQYNYSF